VTVFENALSVYNATTKHSCNPILLRNKCGQYLEIYLISLARRMVRKETLMNIREK
jgi:hypothetical protein